MLYTPQRSVSAAQTSVVYAAYGAAIHQYQGRSNGAALNTQVADLGAFDIFTNFSFNLFPSIKAEFPKLMAFADRVAARPKLAAYIESEKYTTLGAFPNLE